MGIFGQSVEAVGLLDVVSAKAYCAMVGCSWTQRGRRRLTQSPHPCRGRSRGSSGATDDTNVAGLQAASLRNVGALTCLHRIYIISQVLHAIMHSPARTALFMREFALVSNCTIHGSRHIQARFA